MQIEGFEEFCKTFLESKNSRRSSEDDIVAVCRKQYELNCVQYHVDMNALTAQLSEQLPRGTFEVELFPFCVAMQTRDVVTCCMNDGHIVMCSTHEASKLYDTYFCHKKYVFIHDAAHRTAVNEAINAKDSLKAMKLIHDVVFSAVLETEV